MITTAVIMAAGKGTRFGFMTETKPKGFIEFKGIPMIIRSIENLLSCGITKIIIGTGYHHEWYDMLAEKYPQIQTVFSPRFAETNSMETLSMCKESIGNDDFLLLESDLVYEKAALSILLEDIHNDVMLVSDVIKFQDQYYIAVDRSFNLLNCSTDKDLLIKETGNEPYGELVGINKISRGFFKQMIEDYERKHDKYIKRGYEFEILDVANPSHSCVMQNERERKIPMFVLKPKLLQWYEIDDENDLKFAENHIQIN